MPRYSFGPAAGEWDWVLYKDGAPVNYYAAPRAVVDQMVDALNAGTDLPPGEVREHVENERRKHAASA